MAIDFPSREDIAQQYLDTHEAELPEQDTTRGSDAYRRSRVMSAIAWLVLAKLVFMDKNFLPDTADADYLARWGGPKVLNVPQKGASQSQGVEALHVTGSGPDGTVIDVGLELAAPDGTLFQVAAPALGNWTLEGGVADVSVSSIGTGLSTNKDVGTVLTFTAPPVGIDADATLTKKLTGGLDIEATEDYRGRIVDDLADPPTPDGGAIHDYQKWVKSVPGVQQAFVWEHRRGLGTVDVAGLQAGSGADRIIADLTPISDVIAQIRPGGCKDVKTLTIAQQALDVTAAIEIDETVYGWDWDDGGADFPITAFDSGASTITVPTAPASVVAGVRLTVGGEEAAVTSRVGSVLTLGFSPPPATPTNPDPVAPTWFSFDVTGFGIRASGDLVVTVRQALLAKFDQLGPARGEFAAFQWDDSIRVSKLLGASVDQVAGVVDSELVTPTDNVTATDPYEDDPTNDSVVNLLVPGRVAVVKKVS